MLFRSRESTVDTIEQSVYFVDKANKRRLLAYLLEEDVYKRQGYCIIRMFLSYLRNVCVL